MSGEAPDEANGDRAPSAEPVDTFRGFDDSATIERPRLRPLRAAWDDESRAVARDAPGPLEGCAGRSDSDTSTPSGTFDFDGFYLAHHARLVLAMTRVCRGDRCLAEDVVQQAFLAAYRRRTQLHELDNPAGWLYTVARRAAVEVFRREELRRRRSLELQALSQPAAEFESSVALGDLLARLPDRERQAIEYRYVIGHPRKEIARQMGLSVRTVDSLISKALGRMKCHLRPTEEDES